MNGRQERNILSLALVVKAINGGRRSKMRRFSMEHQEARRMVSPIHDLKGKYVHHIDGDPANNTLDNFAVVTPKQHRLIHVLMGGYKPIQGGPPRNRVKDLPALIALYNEGIWIETYCTD